MDTVVESKATLKTPAYAAKSAKSPHVRYRFVIDISSLK